MYRGFGLAGRGNFLYNISVEERCGMQHIQAVQLRAIRDALDTTCDDLLK